MARTYLLLLLLASSVLCAAQQNPPDIGPVSTTLQDDIGTATPPANPSSGRCRRYFNLNTGAETWINSSGAPCGPSGSGGNISPLRINQIRIADNFNWSQTPSGTISTGSNTVTLAPCPAGFVGANNNSNKNHWIYLDSAVGDAQQPGEPVLITNDNCPAGNPSGTIAFSAAYVHAAGYTLESGTGGVKEALIDGNQVRTDSRAVWVMLTPNAVTTMKAPLYWQTWLGRLDGSSTIECVQNMPCINVGDTNSVAVFANGNANQYVANVMNGFWIRAASNNSGAAFAYTNFDLAPSSPSSITDGSNNVTLTFATCPTGFWPLIPNQILWLNGTSGGLNTSVYNVTAPGPGDFVTVTGGTCTPGASNGTIIVAQATPGLSTLKAHDAGFTLSNGVTPFIEDNSEGSSFSNILTNSQCGGSCQVMGSLLQVDNDQLAQVSGLQHYGGIRCDNDYCGPLMFLPGPNGINAGIVFAQNIQTNGNPACVQDYDGNDITIKESICQAYADQGAYISTRRGGSLQRAHFSGIHFERGGLTNSLGGGYGAASIEVQGYNLVVDGNSDFATTFPSFPVVGSPGGDTQSYYLSILNTTDNTKSIPIPIGTASVTNPNSNNVTVKWVTTDAVTSKTIQFELYRIDQVVSSGSVAALAPYPGLCDGVGGDGTCLVATGISPATACDIHGACNFTDTLANASLTAATIETGLVNSTNFLQPNIGMAPGNVILQNGGNYQGDPACITNWSPWTLVNASANTNGYAPAGCMASPGANNQQLTAVPSASSGNSAQMGLLLPDQLQNNGGVGLNLKGRINFMNSSNFPRCIATWYDFNPTKTMATTAGYAFVAFPHRPVWDLGDACTGNDSSTSMFNMFSNTFHLYANVLPNSSANNWTYEFSTSQLTSNVPVSAGGTAGVGGAWVAPEGTAVSSVGGKDILYADSTQHAVMQCLNGAACHPNESANGATSQKTESAADSNVLTYSPVSVAGTYQVCFTMSVSAASAATLGWTATWTDSNGNAQTPTNLALFQTGTAAPALTFTTSTTGNYGACQRVDINNAGTAIVVKLTFSGTSFTAKVSATVERIL